MIKLFSRPSIASTIDDQIYEAKRALIDSAGRVALAKSKVVTAEADVAYHQSRLAELNSQRQLLAEAA